LGHLGTEATNREKSPVNVTQVHKSNPLCCAAVGSTASRRRDDAHGALSRQGYLFCSAQNARLVGCRLLSCLLSEFVLEAGKAK
jgi:hypothetical protein